MSSRRLRTDSLRPSKKDGSSPITVTLGHFSTRRRGRIIFVLNYWVLLHLHPRWHEVVKGGPRSPGWLFDLKVEVNPSHSLFHHPPPLKTLTLIKKRKESTLSSSHPGSPLDSTIRLEYRYFVTLKKETNWEGSRTSCIFPLLEYGKCTLFVPTHTWQK